jgi:hypothetical protein
MKVQPGKFIILSVFICSLVLSCKKEQDPSQIENDVVNRYLELITKMNAMNSSTGQMRNFLSVIGASQFHSNMLSLKSALGDSVITDTIPVDTTGYWGYWTCATVTETDNDDHSHTTVYDYGDGCDEYGTFTSGRITYVWKNEGNEYYSKVIYDRYYSFGMEINGYSEYSFISDGNSYYEYDTAGYSSKDSLSSPGVIFYWSGTSTGKDNITMKFDDGKTYSYTSNYANKWDNNSYTVLEGEYECYAEPGGYEYHYQVTKPMFYDYTCQDTWIAVSGVENIHYIDSLETYDFSVDYGNGTCDNFATVIENGETSVIDFGELFIYYGGTEAGDSVVVRKRK